MDLADGCSFLKSRLMQINKLRAISNWQADRFENKSNILLRFTSSFKLLYVLTIK